MFFYTKEGLVTAADNNGNAKNNNDLKLLYLAKILLEETDDEHGLNLVQLKENLQRYDVRAERKAIYSDLKRLRRFGMDIIGEKDGRAYLYRIGMRRFQLVEIKLLVDCVQSAKFVTEEKSRELVGKLESLVSKHNASLLKRQVFISGRVKTSNRRIYLNIDKIHTAISQNVQIRFKYFQWNADKERELRRGGEYYVVSPWYLLCDNEYYYLIAYDDESKICKHYRVDKMLDVGVTDRLRRGRTQAEKTDAAHYAKTFFGMYGGEAAAVTIEAENRFAGILIDRFGSDIPIRRIDDGHFCTRVEVVPNRLFMCWIFSLGEGIKITAPTGVVEEIRRNLFRLGKAYNAAEPGGQPQKV